MAFAIPQTPQRPLPGAFLSTPAPNGFGRAVASPSQALNKAPSFTNVQSNAHPAPDYGSVQQQPSQHMASTQVSALSPTQRAANDINNTLREESRFPELDNYVGRT
jgi:nuclear pore complex protein Nup155